MICRQSPEPLTMGTPETKDDVVSLLKENRSTIKAYGVRRLRLFGSFLHGRQTTSSDIDLLVDFKPSGKTFDNFMNLSFFLEDMLHRPVELVTPESLSPHIGPRILQEAEDVALGP
jgi:predicted nucleotidyltransferase